MGRSYATRLLGVGARVSVFMVAVWAAGAAWAADKASQTPAPPAAPPKEVPAKEPKAVTVKQEPAAARNGQSASPKRRWRFEATAVSGKAQRPEARYVLPPNVQAVRDAANSLSDSRLEDRRSK